MPTIFLNKDAVDINELFLNEEWTLEEIHKNIYTITVEKDNLNWILKVYDRKRFALKESQNLKKLDGIKNVPKLLAVGLSDSLNYVILSKASGVDLFDYVDLHGPFSENTIKPVARQLLTTLRKLHKRNVVHKDIKPENIMYDNEYGKITIVDFEEKYTDGYCSPEQLKNEEITEKTDIWSLGATIFYAVTGSLLFNRNKDILNKPIHFRNSWSLDFVDFLHCLLERCVDLRYTAKEALAHVWLLD